MDNIAFWGIFLILAGLALLVKVIFNIEFPLFRVLAGIFLILLGLKIIFGEFILWPFKSGDNEIFFSTEKIYASDAMLEEYHIIFSHTTFDLGEMRYPDMKTDLRFNNIFSGNKVYLPPGIPVKIKVDAVFAGVKMPGRNTPVFGRGTYNSEGFDPDLPHLNITANVVFGNILFMYKP